MFNFPWEGNMGDNQHYHAVTTGSDLIVAFTISYTDPLPGTAAPNTLHDIHNIDVTSAQVPSSVVPEPTSLALAGFAGIGMAVGAWRRRRLEKPSAA